MITTAKLYDLIHDSATNRSLVVNEIRAGQVIALVQGEINLTLLCDRINDLIREEYE